MDTPLPLAGIRVLDCSRVYAGPIASMLLGDLGAEIWKVEPPAGDDHRVIVISGGNVDPAFFAKILTG